MDQRSATARRLSRRSTAVLLLLALVVAACAHRSPRAEIIAAYGDDPTTGALGSPESVDGTPESTAPGGPPVTDGPDADGAEGDGDQTLPPDASSDGNAQQGDGEEPGETPTEAPPTADKSPVNIGHIGTYSGVIGAIFAGGGPMAQAWAQDVNARGGLNGHPVNLISADDGGDPARAQSLVRDMVENQDVIAFVGNLTILTTQAYRRYIEQARIPVIGGDLYNLVWWDSPMLFPNGSHLDATILGMAEQAVESGGPEIALVRCVETFACQRAGSVLGGGGAGEVGADLVYDEEISLAQPNFTRECLAAERSGATAVLVGADVNATSRFARDCKTQGYEPVLIGTSLAATDAAASDPNLEGFVVVSAVFPWNATDTEAAAQHSEVLTRYAPSVAPSGSTAQVWTGGKLLEAAAVDLPDDPTSEDVIEGLYRLGETTVEGLAPTLHFERDQPGSQSRCYSVIELVGGEFTAPDGSSFRCL